MELSQRPSRDPQLREIFVWAVLGLFFAGYPLAWIVVSRKSVLRSSDPGFVDGFGVGVGVTLGIVLGVTLLGVAWSRFARRYSSLNRRRLGIALMAGFFFVALAVTAAALLAY